MKTTRQSVRRRPGVRSLLGELPNSTYIFVVLFVAFWFTIPNFNTPGNLSTLLQQASILSLLSAAMALAIMTRGIDLSVGSTVSFVGVIIALLIGKGYSEAAAIALGLGGAMLFGFINGFIVVKMKVVPFISTFGMLGVGQGIANLLSSRRALYLEAHDGRELKLIQLLQSDVFRIELGDGHFFAINAIVAITIAVLIVMIVLFKGTVLNAYVYAIGNNREAAKLSNIRVDFWNILIYVVTGLLAGIAGLLMLIRVNSAQPLAGEGLEFQAVVAAVLGGNLLSGGKAGGKA